MKEVLVGLVSAIILVITLSVGFVAGLSLTDGINGCRCSQPKYLKLPNRGQTGASGANSEVVE